MSRIRQTKRHKTSRKKHVYSPDLYGLNGTTDLWNIWGWSNFPSELDYKINFFYLYFLKLSFKNWRLMNMIYYLRKWFIPISVLQIEV